MVRTGGGFSIVLPTITINNFLVGGFNPSEKYHIVSWDDDIPNIWKSKKCSKPPTRSYISILPTCLLRVQSPCLMVQDGLTTDIDHQQFSTYRTIDLDVNPPGTR
jgi:predicted HAD superfamily phosphohydrolase YqeG